MTGAELIKKIQELKAEDMEVICLNTDGLLSEAYDVRIAPDAQTGVVYVVIT